MLKSGRYLALFISASSHKLLKMALSNNSFLINKLSTKFENIIIINVFNLKFFKKKFIHKSSTFKSFNFKENIEFFNVNSKTQLFKIISNKQIVGINFFGRSLNDLRIFYLLKNIKIVQISGIGSVQTNNSFLQNNFIKGFFYKKYKELSYKFLVLLSNFKIISKMEIRFITNSKLLPKNRKLDLYQRIFNYLKLDFAKKFILINSRSFDFFYDNPSKSSDEYIVVLDEILNDPQWTRFRPPFNSKQIHDHYKNFNQKLNSMKKEYQKKVVICIHPNDNLNQKKKLFKDFKVVQYNTRSFIYKAYIVVFFESSAIIDAILLRKNIITVKSDILDNNQVEAGEHYIRELKIPILHLNKKNFKKKDIYFKKNLYEKYINTYISPDKSRQKGYLKIAKHINKLFNT